MKKSTVLILAGVAVGAYFLHKQSQEAKAAAAPQGSSARLDVFIPDQVQLSGVPGYDGYGGVDE